MTRVGPLVVTPSFSRLPLPSPWPSEVTKSSLSTNERLPCAMVMNTSWQEVAISGAPPPPGSRTLGLLYGPTTVVLRLAKRSICAPPRKPTVMRPPCSQ